MHPCWWTMIMRFLQKKLNHSFAPQKPVPIFKFWMADLFMKISNSRSARSFSLLRNWISNSSSLKLSQHIHNKANLKKDRFHLAACSFCSASFSRMYSSRFSNSLWNYCFFKVQSIFPLIVKQHFDLKKTSLFGFDFLDELFNFNCPVLLQTSQTVLFLQ